MGIVLSPRLNAAASLVRGGGTVADIGTDHGYLPVFLTEQGLVSFAVCSDIGKLPLENAKKAVEKSGLSEKISLRLSDGLKGFSPGEADEFVFAGMGGTLIVRMLEETSWIKDKNLHFVFQPQSRAEELREFLYKNGFEIGREIAVHENRRYYIAFDAYYTGAVKKYSPADCFTGKLPKTEDGRKYVSLQLARIEKKYNAVKENGEREEAEALKSLTEKLKEFIYV